MSSSQIAGCLRSLIFWLLHSKNPSVELPGADRLASRSVGVGAGVSEQCRRSVRWFVVR
jgi:hypothetical protein